MDTHDKELIQIEIPTEDWIIFAAVAWMGYQLHGRGVVILELDDEETSETSKIETTTNLFYLPATRGEIKKHADQNPQLAQWINGYNPERSLLFALAHPIGVYYALLETPGSYPLPSDTHPPENEDLAEAMNCNDSSILAQWPDEVGAAQSHYTAAEQGVLIVDVPYPSEADINAMVERALEKAERDFFRAMKESAPAALTEHRSQRTGFEERLAERWGQALDLYETVLIYARTFGEDFVRKYHADAANENDLVFTVLARLHARACLTASEVLALLRSGYAAGAHARWRTLHEISSVAYFVKQFGQDVAEQYLEHEHIEAYRAADEYQRHCKRLGYQPYTESDMKAFRRERDRLLKKYGKDFEQDYGWAVDTLRTTNPSFKGRTSFAQIERAAGINHWRPYYRMASHCIHANPKGIAFNLGLIKQGSMLLAGPSNAGLTDQGHSASISLSQVTTSLLLQKPNDFEFVMSMKALHHFVKEAGEAFLAAQQNLERDEARQRADRKP